MHRTHPIALGIARAGFVGTPDRSRPLRERSTLVSETLALLLRLDVDELLQLTPELDTLDAVVRNAKANQCVSEAHHSKADATNSLRESVDFRERVLVDVD